ncbi:MAG: hypothetical protein V4724_20155 [Pseudomonadota bacterium]
MIISIPFFYQIAHGKKQGLGVLMPLSWRQLCHSRESGNPILRLRRRNQMGFPLSRRSADAE